MFRHHIGENAAAHIEFGGEAHVSWLYRCHQVVKYAVGDGFLGRHDAGWVEAKALRSPGKLLIVKSYKFCCILA